MKFLSSFFLLISVSAFAQKANVLVVDPDLDATELQKDFNVQKPAQAYALPDKEERDVVFSGIKSVAGYDELKKDILFMDLKKKSPADIMKKYPQLSKQDIKTMLERQ